MRSSRGVRQTGGGRPSRLRELAGLVLIAFSLFLFLSLLSFHPGDPSFSRSLGAGHRVRNLMGVAGSYAADLAGQVFGAGALVVPLLLAWASLRIFAGLPALRLGFRFLGWALAYMAASGLLYLSFEKDPYFGVLPGGLAGYLAAAGLGAYLNLWGAYLALGTTLLLLLVALTGARPSRLLGALLRLPARALRSLGRALAAGGRGLLRLFGHLRVPRLRLPAISLPWRVRKGGEVAGEEAPSAPVLSLERLAGLGGEDGEREKALSLPSPEEPPPGPRSSAAELPARAEEALSPPDGSPSREGEGLPPGTFSIPLPQEEVPLSPPEDRPRLRIAELARLSPSRPRRAREYRLPPLDLFSDPPSERVALDERLLAQNASLLEKALLDYGVAGKVVEVKAGPIITTYEFAPASGVKVSKIAGLSDDLALAMRALSVRIVAPIPGKAVVGIELPNPRRQPVVLKEVLGSPEFQGAPGKLTIAVGKDILGRPVVTDLTQIPHLLIAGATGSGKSVALNAMVCSLLCRATPKEVKLVMLDPKMLELSAYDGIPHLLVPVATHPKKAAGVLRGLVAEMERRYRVLAEKGVRNIEGYNDLVAMELGPERARRAPFAPGGEGEFLPYTVVVIDELADLMMVSSKEVEDSLIRLAQMARASGIHLLVATQRPSVDVLTGLIKANFPARISFKVSSRTDSRTILDANGAERLLGRGDMLFLAPGTSNLRRIHAPYVTEKEVARIAEWWIEQDEPSYDETLLTPAAASPAGEEDEWEHDGRYEEAVRLVARTREASISLLQRHLRVGYNRAARMIERMEREGLVGPSDGIRRREVYVKEPPEG